MKKQENKRCIVHLENVTKIFGVNEHKTTAVRNVSLQASLGELLVLLGPSGSGKTTLLTLIAGLIRSTSGKISLFGRNIEYYSSQELQQLRATRIGFVFQTFLLIDSLTAIENVALVLRFAGKSKNEALGYVQRLLQQFQIEHLAEKFPSVLSQGEKQRIAVARALVNNPDLIIADEPTGSLETKQGFEIIRLLHEYGKRQNRCVIVATHDPRISELADRVLQLEDGGLVQTTPSAISSRTR
jgi:putative ABC transport system ATP-binding protein